MPEYLSPGVYVEEVSFRSKSIEGVPTSTTGFAGLTRTGPVQYVVDGSSLRGPDASEPRLITSFTEFERVYGGLDPMTVDGDERIPYLAHAARAFFMNGGSRLYVSRVFYTDDTTTDAGWGIATRPLAVNSAPATQAAWRARWPGKFGEVLIQVNTVRGKNVGFVFPATPGDPLHKDLWGRQAKGMRSGGIVEVLPAATSPLPIGNATLDRDKLRVVRVDPTTGRQTFEDHTGAAQPLNADDILQPVTLQVVVHAEDERLDRTGACAARTCHLLGPDEVRRDGRRDVRCGRGPNGRRRMWMSPGQRRPYGSIPAVAGGGTVPRLSHPGSVALRRLAPALLARSDVAGAAR